MSNNIIVYEQPLNELMRYCLHLEYLFKQISHCLQDMTITHSVEIIIRYLIDILELLNRPDLKSKFAKRCHDYLTIFSGQAKQQPDNSDYQEKCTKLQQLIHYFLGTTGKIAQPLREDPLIATIQQCFIHCGNYYIDTPSYHYWLKQNQALHDQQIHKWLTHLTTISDAVELLVTIARNNGHYQQIVAKQGFYQQSLDSSLSWQLIRVGIDQAQPLYPEISAGKYRITARFITPNSHHKPEQTNDDVTFQLSCCAT